MEHWPGSVPATRLVEQLIAGFSTSLTVTLNVQVAVPHPLEAVAVTRVVPTGKVVPGFWE